MPAMRARWWVTGLLLAVGAVGGCGGDGQDRGGAAASAGTPAKKGPPPAEQVEQSVVTIVNTCTEKAWDEGADTGPVSAEVDTLIALFNKYDPDATMGESDLRASTLRQALSQMRDDTRTCSPADTDRISDTLTSSPPPEGATGAVTSDPAEEDAEEQATPEPGAGGRGVATIASELATLCVDRITSGDTGPATAEIEQLVDDLVQAYQSGPKNSATKLRMQVARSNLRDGCGSDQTGKVADALAAG